MTATPATILDDAAHYVFRTHGGLLSACFRYLVERAIMPEYWPDLLCKDEPGGSFGLDHDRIDEIVRDYASRLRDRYMDPKDVVDEQYVGLVGSLLEAWAVSGGYLPVEHGYPA